MRILNRRQRVVLLLAIALFAAIALLPPWRYLNGDFAGFAPVWSPPAPLADSLLTEEIAQEYVPIKIVPMGLSEVEYKTEFDHDEYARPFLDVRKMMAVGTIVLVLGLVALFVLDDRRRKATE